MDTVKVSYYLPETFYTIKYTYLHGVNGIFSQSNDYAPFETLLESMSFWLIIREHVGSA